MMQRRDILRLAGAAALAAALPRAGSAAEPKRKPNILFIFADDMRPDAIGALGNPAVKTPVLDGLVSRGVSFTRVYTMGSMIGAVCLPSRTMLLTGRSMFRIPARNRPAPEGGYPLLPAAMKSAGYETFHIGKSGNEYGPGIKAFDRNIVSDDRNNERAGSSEKHANAVIKFLRERQASSPFFIYMAPPVPHDPRIAPQKFMDMYDPAKIPVPRSFAPVHPFDNGEMTVRDEKLAPWPRTPEIVQRHRADYYACISCLDFHIGRIIDTLRELGQLDNTIIVFSGDNGLSVGDHGLFGKQNLYEFGGMHVPLVIAGPGIPQGRRDALAYLMDLFPTFCDLAGAQTPKAVEGRSLAPVIQGTTNGVRDCLFTAYSTGQRAVRDDRWKLIRYPLINKTQLFDLQSDPLEQNDLSSNPAHAERVKSMLALLKQQQERWSDPHPLEVPNPRSPEWKPPA